MLTLFKRIRKIHINWMKLVYELKKRCSCIEMDSTNLKAIWKQSPTLMQSQLSIPMENSIMFYFSAVYICIHIFPFISIRIFFIFLVRRPDGICDLQPHETSTVKAKMNYFFCAWALVTLIYISYLRTAHGTLQNTNTSANRWMKCVWIMEQNLNSSLSMHIIAGWKYSKPLLLDHNLQFT